MIPVLLTAGVVGVILLVIWSEVKSNSVDDSEYWETFDPADHT